MLKRITTGAAALAALGALALGGSVIASAKQPAQAHHSARAASSTVNPAGGPNDQSGNQTAPDTGSATAASAEAFR